MVVSENPSPPCAYSKPTKPIDIPERGMVITVYHDPCHLQESSYYRLRQLQDGVFGPFYGP